MVEAIIFDCFGVLASEGWLPFKAKYFGHDPSLYKRVSDISEQSNRGLIGWDEAIRTTAKLAGITTAAAIEEISRNVPDEELFKYIRELKPKYKLGFLSNISGNYLHKIFSEDQLALFDNITLSYKTGLIKPQPEAFLAVAELLNVSPRTCVLVDDQQRNVEGAQRAGMQAILYHEVGQFKDELEALLTA